MNLLALSVVVITALAAFGLAAWTWYTVAAVGDELRDFAGIEVIDFEQERKASVQVS